MEHYFEIQDAEVRVWIEQESIHIQAADLHGDPVELNADEARIIASVLLGFSEKLDGGAEE